MSAQGLSREESASFLMSLVRAQNEGRQVISERVSRKRSARNKESSWGSQAVSATSEQSKPNDRREGGPAEGEKMLAGGWQQHGGDRGKGMQVERLLLLLDGALLQASREAAAVQLAQLFQVRPSLALSS